MSNKPKVKKQKLHKVNIRGNKETNEVNVTFSPGGSVMKLEDRQTLINVAMAGNDIAMKKLLGNLPILRPAGEAEREEQIYVFKDAEKDNQVFKMRKQMYDTIAGVMQKTLSDLFPDVEYIEECRNVQQDKLFDMSKEEAEEYTKKVEAITEQVRSENNGTEEQIN